MEHIENERERLGENLDEIESRFKDATDPRAWFDKNPAMILGAAAAGGILLGYLAASRSSHEARPVGFSSVEPEHRVHRESKHLTSMRKTLDTTVAALVGLGAQKVQDFISDALPGYQQQYDVARQRQAAWDSADPESSRTH